MKRLLIASVALFTISQAFAQTPTTEEITKKNSWLKIGANVGVPVGDVADIASFAAGIELSGQLMRTRNFGIGIATGYTNYFAKENFSSFGAIPLGLMLRYYPQSKGFFGGIDAGYSFLTNVDNYTGGFYFKPQLGYHNYDWNVYGFYNHIAGSENNIDIQSVGIAATYNIRFNKK